MNDALNELKELAELSISTTEHTRRPTWAPPLILDGELLDLLRELKQLSPDAKPIARLWALFTDPRRGPVACQGFQLRAGQERRGFTLFEAKYCNWAAALTQLRAALEKDKRNRRYYEFHIAKLEAQSGDWSCGPLWSRPEAYKRVVELASARVLDFAGAPEAQMKLGGILTGNCCICGKVLTDPHSIEYGIGPECRAGWLSQRLNAMAQARKDVRA